MSDHYIGFQSWYLLRTDLVIHAGKMGQFQTYTNDFDGISIENVSVFDVLAVAFFPPPGENIDVVKTKCYAL